MLIEAPVAGRVAVVTGAGRGIGRAIALRLAQQGITVTVSSRTESDLNALVAQVEAAGGHALGVVADAGDPQSARAPVRAAVTAFGRVDIVVNNVGGVVGSADDQFEGDDESFERTLVLNL